MLSNITAIARVLDAQTVVVGMRPQVAITLVKLGRTPPGIHTAQVTRPSLRPRHIGFSLVDQTKFVTAASEIARNTIDHGGANLRAVWSPSWALPTIWWG